MIRLNPTRIALTTGDLRYHLDRIGSQSPRLAIRHKGGKESYDGDGIFLDSDTFSVSDSFYTDSDCDPGEEEYMSSSLSGSYQESQGGPFSDSLSAHGINPSTLRGQRKNHSLHSASVDNCSSSIASRLKVSSGRVRNSEPAFTRQPTVAQSVEQVSHLPLLGLKSAHSPNTRGKRVNVVTPNRLPKHHLTPQTFIVLGSTLPTLPIPLTSFLALAHNSNKIKYSESFLDCIVLPTENLPGRIELSLEIPRGIQYLGLASIQDLPLGPELQTLRARQRRGNQGSGTRTQGGLIAMPPNSSTAEQQSVAPQASSHSTSGSSLREVQAITDPEIFLYVLRKAFSCLRDDCSFCAPPDPPHALIIGDTYFPLSVKEARDAFLSMLNNRPNGSAIDRAMQGYMLLREGFHGLMEEENCL